MTRLCTYGIYTLQYHYALFICISSRLLSLSLLHFQLLHQIRRPYPLQIQALLLPPLLQHFDSSYREGRYDLLRVCGYLWIHQVCIEVTGHQQLILEGLNADCRNNFLYG